MKLRAIAGITLAVILPFAILGLFMRQSYTDIQTDENFLAQLQVAELSESLAATSYEQALQTLPHAPYILRVQVLGDAEFLFGGNRQKVRVQEIYSGNDLKPGDEIYLVGRASLALNYEPKTAECHFVNIPKAGYEYLIFAEEQLEVPNEDTPIYSLCGDLLFSPVFCYEDFPHTIAPTNGSSTYVPYTAVSENEFFAVSEAGLQIWSDLKHQLLALYPASE